jgi:hypothetical protein
MSKPFLPEGYKVPKTGGGVYTKFNDGANRFRIISAPIVGWLYWNDQNKPVRLREQPTSTPKDIRVKDGKPEKMKHFWALVVWNYQSKALEILEVAQSTVQNAITALVNSEDWGDAREYDITITKTGTDLNTEYTVMPGRAAPVNPLVKHEFEKKNINLEALYEGGNPFEAGEGPQPEAKEAEIADAEDLPGVPHRSL